VPAPAGAGRRGGLLIDRRQAAQGRELRRLVGRSRGGSQCEWRPHLGRPAGAAAAAAVASAAAPACCPCLHRAAHAPSCCCLQRAVAARWLSSKPRHNRGRQSCPGGEGWPSHLAAGGHGESCGGAPRTAAAAAATFLAAAGSPAGTAAAARLQGDQGKVASPVTSGLTQTRRRCIEAQRLPHRTDSPGNAGGPCPAYPGGPC
jgi:hypothetical protein